MEGQPRHSTPRLVRLLVLAAVGMFGFGFALVPLYGVFCDLTGFGGRSMQTSLPPGGLQPSGRDVRVRFLATTNSSLPWVFEPLTDASRVRLGELSNTRYLAVNSSDEPVAGQAIYNVTPPEASLYFIKTECFCFTRQLLQANESREMPVYFYVRPDLPESIREITLSYTFFRADADGQELAAADGG